MRRQIKVFLVLHDRTKTGEMDTNDLKKPQRKGREASQLFSVTGVRAVGQWLRNFMIKRLGWIFIALMGCFPQSGFSQQAVSIVIMPFEIHAKEELSYLQMQIPDALKKQLEEVLTLLRNK